MGSCESSNLTAEEAAELKAQKAFDTKFTKVQKKREAVNRDIIKLLLLGAGESGKSTLFKQMVKLYGNGYSTSDLQEYTHSMKKNILEAVRTLIKQSRKRCEENPVLAISPNLSEEVDLVLNSTHREEILDLEIANAIKKIWGDMGIKMTFGERSSFQLSDGAEYLLNHVLEIGAPGYCPTDEDILHARVRTTGIVEETFTVDQSTLQVYDLGGQRNERRKWIQCFDSVNAIIFVAAISAYDQVLYEDLVTNRMEEALNLFSEICNAPHFRDTSMILFLNKSDLFAQKFVKNPPSCYFPDYNPDQHEEEQEQFEYALEFLKQKFLDRNENPEEKDVFIQVTNATDTKNMVFVLRAMQAVVLESGMQSSGMVFA